MKDDYKDLFDIFENISNKNEENPLTPHQNQIMEDIFQAINDGHKKILLQGSAGTGKTFLVSILIREFYKRYMRNGGLIQITAPTNKAVAVLLDKAGDNIEYYMEYLTIHKALQLKREIDEKTGEMLFIQKINEKSPPFKGCKLLIVDEASMISTEILDFISAYNTFPILYIADNKQLNPVKEEDSPVFLQNYPTFTLTEIIRQAEGNPIIHLSHNLPLVKLEESNLTNNNLGYTYTRDEDYIIDLLAKNPRDTRYLAWTNAEVNRMNFLVRRKIYDTPNKLELGEMIILSQPYGEMWTNYELEIESIEIKTKNFYWTKDDFIELTYYLINKDIFAIHEISQNAFIKKNKELKALCVKGDLSWKIWYNFVEMFIKFTYLYAITIHRS